MIARYPCLCAVCALFGIPQKGPRPLHGFGFHLVRCPAALNFTKQRQGSKCATARHRYGLTQRQAKGNFSISEASDLIERLTAEAEAVPGDAPVFNDPGALKAQAKIDRERSALLRGIPAEVLADELQRRGWAVIPPT